MHSPLDYERLGRQIALPELGVDGQRALASRPVRFCGDPLAVADAERLWTHAGGVIAAPDAHDDTVLEVSLRAIDGLAQEPIAALGVAAWGALDAARALLHWSTAERPATLDAALTIEKDPAR